MYRLHDMCRRSIVPSCVLLLVACGDGEYGRPPALTDIGVTTAEDEPVVVVVPVSAIEANALAFAVLTPPAHGALTGDGPTWTYTPETDYVGEDTLVVRGEDRYGSATATVTMTMTPVDDAPVAGADSFATVFDTPLTIAQSTLVANDTDIDSEELSVTTVEAAVDGHGVPVLSGTDVVFTPESGFEGDASFVYTLSDGELTAQGTVTVAVGMNRAPVAVDDAATTDEDTLVAIAGATLLANDSDPDGQTLTISDVGNASHGDVSYVGADVIFVPEANHVGAGGFEYTITDGVTTAVGTVVVTIASVNDAPVVTTTSGAAAYTENDAALLLDGAVGVTDVDADTLAGATVQLTTGCADPEDVLELASPPSGITVTGYTAATCTLALSGAVSPATYQAALRLVTYRNTSETPATAARVAHFTVDDGAATGNTGSADRNLTVAAVDDSPVAVSDTKTVAEDASATAITVLSNDTDVDSGSMTIASVTQPSNGTVAITGSGTGVNYTPAVDYCNTPPGSSLDTFTYTLSPGGSTATVSVTVTCVNDAPVVTTSVGAAAYTENDAALVLDPAVGVTDVDADTLA
ncbi:MAG TPA: Ig-like domain-containing protein, partial [Kofleriaceae bacterium]|nr:Ig-like domain-containing protein [Kofleriaceae bacterium]